MSKYQELKKLKLTEEEKTRWAAMFHQTWQAIAYDAMEACQCSGQKLTKSIIVEYVCDANRVQQFAGMTDEEYAFLGAIYSKRSFQDWAKKVLNY